MDHLLEKSTYPELKYVKDNIVICTWEEHSNKSGPAEHPKHRELINKVKQKWNY